MLQLTSISVEKYRCFRNKARLELRPMTLLLGHNSAGKSTLLRMLPVLESSVSESATSPLDLSGPEGGGTNFLRSLWRPGNLRWMALELEWDEDGEQRTDRFQLRYEDHLNLVYIEHLTLSKEGQVLFDAQSLPHPSVGTFILGGTETPLEFVGLVPIDPSIPELKGLRGRLRSLRQKVHWLSSIRTPPSHTTRLQGSRLRRLQHNGSDAAQVLIQDRDILDGVDRWYRSDEIKRSLRTQPVSSDEYHLLLDTIDHTDLKIDLADTGDGMAQVMPVLVAAALAKRQGPQAILAVEDPEAHLHENARRALATHLCAIAAQQDAPRMVLETHSRTFLLGVQLAIASGQLPPERVIAYWLAQEPDGRSKAHAVEFTANGAPTNSTLSGVLAEDRALARELLQFQLRSMP